MSTVYLDPDNQASYDHPRKVVRDQHGNSFEMDNSPVMETRRGINNASQPVTRCKLKVGYIANHYRDSLDKSSPLESQTVHMAAVIGEEGTENAEWSRFTPAADFNITISNPNLFNKLVRDHTYFVDISETSS